MYLAKRFLWAFLILISKKSFTQHQTNESAKLILNRAIAELGKGWDTIQALKLEGYGTSFAIDQSERFEGPLYSCTDHQKYDCSSRSADHAG